MFGNMANSGVTNGTIPCSPPATRAAHLDNFIMPPLLLEKKILLPVIPSERLYFAATRNLDHSNTPFYRYKLVPAFPRTDMLETATWNEWLPWSSTVLAITRDSSRRYSFTLLLPFLLHLSLWLDASVLVKHRLLGMTGGEGRLLYYTVILRERRYLPRPKNTLLVHSLPSL